MLRDGSPVGGVRYEDAGAGGRTWVRTVVTANRLVEGAWWDLTVEGRLLVMDGMSWTIVKGEAGTSDCPMHGPGLRVLAEEPPQVEIGDNAEYDMPPHLAAWASPLSRPLSGPLVLRDGRISRPGGSVQGRLHSLNTKKADWIALPYVTSYLEIPWKIEAKRVPVLPAE